MNLAVVTCFFSWAGFKTPERNLWRFIRQMDAYGIRVYGAEAVRPGQISLTGTLKNWVQIPVEPEGELFIKEALLNAAVRERVPAGYDGIAWVDADVMFVNRDWKVMTEALLLHHGAVQPFQTAMWTDERGRITKQRAGLVYARPKEARLLHTGHTGFAMAYRRDVWEKVGGMFPWGVTGSGDALAGAATLGIDYDEEARGRLPAAPWMEKAWKDWSRKMAAEVAAAGGAAYVPGAVIHEFHGGWSGRNYYDRHKLLELAREPRLTAEGMPLCGMALAEGLKGYWMGRAEDEGEDAPEAQQMEDGRSEMGGFSR